MTKIDVLNTFAEIAAATHYRIGGQPTTALPYDLCQADLEAVFKSYKGWECALDAAKTFEDLPVNARVFLEDLEAYLGVPFRMVSTGPEREKLLLR